MRIEIDEQWKDVCGYEGLYTVSNLGRIKNRKGKILKAYKHDIYGHCSVGLSKDNKNKQFQVHRLVALHFIPNPEGKPEVCHKDNTLDENGFLDNSASNLAWGTHKENCQYENTRRRQSENHADVSGKKNPNYGKRVPKERKERYMKEKGKQVLQWENGRVIAFYESLKDAGRKTGTHWTNIRRVCDGHYQRAGGYEWSYAENPFVLVSEYVEAVVAELEEMRQGCRLNAEVYTARKIEKAISIVRGKE